MTQQYELSRHNSMTSNNNHHHSTTFMAPPSEQGKNSRHNKDPKPKKVGAAASQWAGSLLQTTKHSIQSWTVRKFSLPDKHVASQVLMYRQLLHTACRPNLQLSRDYQGTPAQKAVMDMPWWSQRNIAQTKKMIISYQNLLARLWISGACTPYREDWRDYQNTTKEGDLLDLGNATNATAAPTTTEPDAAKDASVAERAEGTETSAEATPAAAATDDSATDDSAASSGGVEEKKETEETGERSVSETAAAEPSSTAQDGDDDDDEGLLAWEKAKFRAPVPHRHWVDRLGFQQEDPVTDFRSGGVLSLAMMVYLVESCPAVVKRFEAPNGDAAVLPFGLTCINVTDMMAKFLMLSKVVDRMDALLSQKPFWRMFADPHAMLTCQEVALTLTADVVVELRRERSVANGGTVSVFDFANILAVVEQRMEYDYLMAGPTSCAELRQIHVRNKMKYQAQLQQRLQMMQSATSKDDDDEAKGTTEKVAKRPAANSKTTSLDDAGGGAATATTDNGSTAAAAAGSWKDKASVVAGSVSSVAGNVWQKVRTTATTSAPSGTAGGFAQVNTTATTPDDDNDLLSSPPPPAAVAGAEEELEDAVDVLL